MSASTASPMRRVPGPPLVSWTIGARSTATTSPTRPARATRGPPPAPPSAPQSGEVAGRSAEAPAEGVADGLELLVRGSLVDERDDAPGSRVEHVAGDLAHVDERQAAHVNAADRARVEVIGVDGVTGAVIGVLADPAW